MVACMRTGTRLTAGYRYTTLKDTDDESVKKVVGMVEKPDPADAPSNLVATGRYVLDGPDPCLVDI